MMAEEGMKDAAEDTDGATVLPFDYSIENHFKAMDTMHKLCCIAQEPFEDATDKEQFLSTITFLREWKQFHYNPRVVKIAAESQGGEGKHVVDEVNLPQFSSANIPKTGKGFSKDFIFHVGGPVWGLDWCPSVPQKSRDGVKCEYLAVASHPPGSSPYHKIGAPLTGRGVVQIWCLVVEEEEVLVRVKKHEGSGRGRGRPRKQSVDKDEGSEGVKDKGSHPLKKAKARGRGGKKIVLKDEESDGVNEECSFSLNKSRARATKKIVLPGEESDGANEQGSLPLKRARGTPRKQIVLHNEKSDDVNEEGSLPLKKARGRARKQIGQKDEGSDVVIEEGSIPLKKARGRPRKQIVQIDEENDGVNEKDLLPLEKSIEKSRGMPESLHDLNRESNFNLTPFAQSGDTIGERIEEDSLPLMKARRKPKMKEIKKLLDSLNREDDFNQTLSGQSGNMIEKDLHPLKKARGKPRKNPIEESLDQFNQTLSGQSGNVIEKDSPPLKKSLGRPRKKKDREEYSDDFDRESDFVRPLTVVFPKELYGTTRNVEEDASVKSFDTDVGLQTDTQCVNDVLKCRSGILPSGKKRKLKDIAREGCYVDAVFPEIDDKNLQTHIQQGSTILEQPHTHIQQGSTILEQPHTHIQQGSTIAEQAHTHTQQGSTIAEQAHTHIQQGSTILEQPHTHIQQGSTIPEQPHTHTQQGSMIPEQPHTHTQQGSMIPEQPHTHIQQGSAISEQDAVTSSKQVEDGGSLENNASIAHLPEDVALPRLVLCLAHNGKVARDVKWRPLNVDDLEWKHRIGYLAIVLGNGSLEVWEVPSPSAIKSLYYASCTKDGTDPRFVKLEPVFRSSDLKYGDRQCMPLTVEWSPFSPHDLILAGCHDGTVALWKFFPSASCQDTRPLICFSADNVPIRALTWAPNADDLESQNLIATAGHHGLRFWDIRDPYRPLWDLNPSCGVIYGLDWLQDPRCLVLSLDDGSLKFISLLNAASDVPVTGEPFVGKQQCMHSYICSLFPIWSVQASKLTGQVAYCSADGLVIRFQLSQKAVEKAVDKHRERNRAPHFLCGSLTEEDAILTVSTPLPNIPFTLKKTLGEWGDTPKSMSGLLSDPARGNKVNSETADQDQKHLALCYGDEHSIGLSDSATAPKEKTARKLSPKKTSDPNVSGSGLEGLDQKQSRTDTGGFPPKVVAVHRVRWNMNKGIERWLCSGGAAGIVRCQEIAMSSIGDY